MNSYIRAQILNITTMTKTFEQACELTAIKDEEAQPRRRKTAKEDQSRLAEI